MGSIGSVAAGTEVHNLASSASSYYYHRHHHHYYVMVATVLHLVITMFCLVKRSCNQFGDHRFAATGPTLWNSLSDSFSSWTSSLDSSNNDRRKRLCLVSWCTAACVWTLRALTRNLLTYFLEWDCIAPLKSRYYHSVAVVAEWLA